MSDKYKYEEQQGPNIGQSWTPRERHIAYSLKEKYTYKQISEALFEEGYDRSPKAIERFFARNFEFESEYLDTSFDESKIKIKKPLKTSWNEPMLVKNKHVEFGNGESTVPVVIIPDTHAPFHDPKAIELACKIIEDVKPSSVIWLGDDVDWVQLSVYSQDPDRINKAHSEVESWQNEVRKPIISAAPDYCKDYKLMGNHEKRMYKYHCAHPAISDFPGMHFDAIFGFDESWKVIPNLQLVEEEILWRQGKFIFKHGDAVRKWSGYTAKAMLEKENTSGISGHVHRAGQSYLTTRGVHKVWTENGCICDLNPEYVSNPNWQHAISIGWFNGNGKTDYFHIDLIPFSKYQAIANGKFFSVK